MCGIRVLTLWWFIGVMGSIMARRGSRSDGRKHSCSHTENSHDLLYLLIHLSLSHTLSFIALFFLSCFFACYVCSFVSLFSSSSLTVAVTDAHIFHLRVKCSFFPLASTLPASQLAFQFFLFPFSDSLSSHISWTLPETNTINKVTTRK